MTNQRQRDLRVLHLVHSGGLYGIERMLLALQPALAPLGVHAGLGCFGAATTSGGAVGAAAAADGGTVFYLGDDPERTLDGVRALWRVLREWQPDLMHYHGYRATIVGSAVATLARVPGVATYHAEANRTVGLRKQLAVESPMLRRLRHVAAVSPAIRAELQSRGVRAERSSVIANGIADPLRRRSSVPGRFNIAVVGRLVPGKNVPMVLRAAAALRADVPGVQVTIAGEGPERAALEREASELGLAAAVHFAGFVADVPRLLADCDAFAMPSDTEGMPMSILEAMAVGVPIVASAVGSIPEVLRDGSDAWLIPPADGTALAQCLRTVAAQPLEVERRVQSARQRFEAQYTAAAMAARYANLYRSVLE